jgi:hypothetical protein
MIISDFLIMKEFIKKHLFIIIFSLAGGAVGFFYWKFVGCLSGTCIIRSVWYLSTIYGVILGYLTGELIKDICFKLKKVKQHDK